MVVRENNEFQELQKRSTWKTRDDERNLDVQIHFESPLVLEAANQSPMEPLPKTDISMRLQSKLHKNWSTPL